MARSVTITVILLAFMFLWFLGNQDFVITSRAVEDLPQDVSSYEGGGFCGDSIRQLGEDCSNCPTDIKCSSNAYCDNGVCIPKKTVDNSFLYIILTIITFGGISFSAYLILRGRIKKKEKNKIVNEEPKHEIKEENKVKTKEITTNYDELENYIENALKKGYSKSDIRELLLKSGWKEDDINFAFRRFNRK